MNLAMCLYVLANPKPVEEAFYGAVLSKAWSGAQNLWKRVRGKKPIGLEEIKKRAQILFIDDESQAPLLENIRQAGWNVRQLIDISNPDASELQGADIVFIDYKGVGAVLSPSEEGIGLLKVLRRKYPTKHFIFYSGYAGFIPGHEFHEIVDGWIHKNADAYVYIERIELAARDLYGATQ